MGSAQDFTPPCRGVKLSLGLAPLLGHLHGLSLSCWAASTHHCEEPMSSAFPLISAMLMGGDGGAVTCP